MEVKAYAKINLSLNVVKKREDGYHELEMIMVPLTLFDTLHITLADQDKYTCDQEGFVIDESNTIVKAVQLMRTTYQLEEHFHIAIEKRIPMQAGLAGGSADAAAVLCGINELLALGICREELSMLGKQIGADVPYCVYHVPSVVKGIGEIVEPFSYAMDFHILLVKPMAGVPTGKAFSMLEFTCCEHPDYHRVERALCKGDYATFIHSLGNTLEQPAFAIVPEIKELKQRLLAMGFDTALMSGSGSTVFAITKDEDVVRNAITQLQQEPYFVYATKVNKS